VLAVFDISKPCNEEPVVGFEPGIVSHPLQYKVRIVPRNEEAEELIRKSEAMWPRGKSDAVKLEALEEKWKQANGWDKQFLRGVDRDISPRPMELGHLEGNEAQRQVYGV
jgi:hypothetical protein